MSRKQALNPWQWKNWPLNRLFLTITVVVLLFLATILALGSRQFLLYRQCSQAVAAGDQLLFQFTTIKDHLNHSLILGEEINLRAFGGELQQMEKEAAALASDLLVPDNLKATLPSRVDLVGLEVRLRAIQEQRLEKVRETAELVHTLGSINVGLQQFRFLLSDHTHNILLGLHKIIAGALGLIVVLSCTILYLLNQSLAAPILALCHLTDPDGGGRGDGDQSCSLHLLTERIRDLLAQGGTTRHEMRYAPDPDRPELLRQVALQYRYGVTGCIGSELASELTNRINGVINYTQALIDLDKQGDDRRQAATIYPSLVNEAQKTAELIRVLQRLGQWQPGHGSSLSLPVLFQVLTLVLEKPLRAESIRLNLPRECAYETPVAAGDLWLVVVSLIQLGRRVVRRVAAGSQSEKHLTIECRPPGDEGRLTLLLTNSTGSWEEERPDPVWPSLIFCTHLLQLHGALLTIDAACHQTRLRISLPCRGSVA